MLQTVKDAELKLLSALHDADVHLWSYGTLATFSPWFYIVTERKHERSSYRDTWLLFHIDQLIEAYESGLICEAHLVSPGNLNRHGCWQMDSLKQVISGEEPREEGQQAYVYVLQNGERYVHGYLESKEEDLENRHVVIDFDLSPPTKRSAKDIQ